MHNTGQRRPLTLAYLSVCCQYPSAMARLAGGADCYQQLCPCAAPLQPGPRTHMSACCRSCRYDESSDAEFYEQPRFVTHIDDGAIRALTK